MKTTLKLLAPLVVALVAFSAEARACTCATNSACQGYWQASSVFVGRRVAVRTVTVEEGDGEGKYRREMRVFRFAVERAYRGPKADFIEVRTGLGGGDCGISFNNVDRYLVYAYGDGKGGVLSTGICTRSAPVSEAAEDLQYIAGLSNSAAAAGGSVYGQVQKQVRDSRGEGRDEISYAPVPGADVEVEGAGKTLKVEADADGRYRIEGLAPGDYTVRLRLPETLLIHGPERKVKIEGSGCVAEWFTVETNGRLSGRVFDAEGRPAPRVALMLSNPEKKDKPYHGHTGGAMTDGEGRYEFKGIPPGRYIIRMRPDAEHVYGNSPYPVIYHPCMLTAVRPRRILCPCELLGAPVKLIAA